MKPKTLRAALNQIQDMLDGQEYSAAGGLSILSGGEEWQRPRHFEEHYARFKRCSPSRSIVLIFLIFSQRSEGQISGTLG